MMPRCGRWPAVEMTMRSNVGRCGTAALGLILSIILVVPRQAAAQAVSWPTTDWPTSTPEEQGMSSSALADLVDFGVANSMDSLLVIRHGRIVVEATYAPFKPGMKHLVNSVTKGIVGTLAGIAFDEGALGPLDQRIVDLFPERTIAHLDSDKQAITLAMLLDSTSGLDWQEPLIGGPPTSSIQMERSGDWVGFVLDRSMARTAGLTFDYNSGTWHLLSAILTKKTGTDPLDFARRKLFTPLGISDVTWRQDPQGLSIGGFGLFMRPGDMARIGYLYLHAGEWEGRQLLPASWVEKVFHPSVDMRAGTTPSFRYANGWWTIPEKNATMAVGFLRQLILVLPDADMVVVTTGRRSYGFPPLIDRLRGAVRAESALPPDTLASARLAARVVDASTEKRSEVGPVSSLAHAISGKSFGFGTNAFGLKSLKLDLNSSSPSYEALFDRSLARLPDSRVAGPIGLDGYFRLADADTDQQRATKGRWLTDTTFQIVSRLVLEGVVTTVNLTFQDGRVEVEIEDNRGVRGRFQGESRESEVPTERGAPARS
jgi:CubicO group peptidase (beta-lactamase class C family)